MHLLFMAHPSFFQKNDYSEAISWINLYAKELCRLGHQVTFFESQNHKIKVFEYIYFFSNNDPETWYELKKLNKTVFICPLFFSGGFSKDFIVKKISYALKFFRACIQRRWPPIDSSFFFKSANHYFVFKNQFSYVNKVWKIPENKITLISEDANEAAKLTHQTIGEAIC